MEIAYIPSGKQVYAKGHEVPRRCLPLPPTRSGQLTRSRLASKLWAMFNRNYFKRSRHLSLSLIFYFFLALQAPCRSIFASWPTHKTFLLSSLILVNALPLNYLRAIIVLCTCRRRGHEVVGRVGREVKSSSGCLQQSSAFTFNPFRASSSAPKNAKSIKIVECCVHILYL